MTRRIRERCYCVELSKYRAPASRIVAQLCETGAFVEALAGEHAQQTLRSTLNRVRFTDIRLVSMFFRNMSSVAMPQTFASDLAGKWQ